MEAREMVNEQVNVGMTFGPYITKTQAREDGGMIYLACPYSHPDPAVRQARHEAANRAAARIMEEGRLVFSPLSHSHPVEQHMAEIHDTAWWMRQDLAFMEHCTECVVLTLPGWRDSKGVAIEIAWFEARGRSVTYRGELVE